MQQAWMGNPSCLEILKKIMDSSEGINFRPSLKEATHAKEVPPYNGLSEDEKHYGLLTRPCCIAGNHRKWKAAVQSPTQQVVNAIKGEGKLSQSEEAGPRDS